MYSHDVNYDYFLTFIKRLPNWRHVRVLDYGCGNGDLVRYLRGQRINCYGTDLFDSLETYGAAIDDLKLQGIVKTLGPDGKIPFCMSFDIIISNQVFEHVRDLQVVVHNIHQKLAIGGVMHHHFPCSEVIREGHIGIPMAHWFPKGPIRFFYALSCRILGFGSFKKDIPLREWTERALTWLDRYCCYREFREIEKLLSDYGYQTQAAEMDYIHFRCRDKPLLRAALSLDRFYPLYEQLFRRLGFRVIDVVRGSIPMA